MRKNKTNHTISGVDPICLENELKEFDHVRWAIACRHMQLRLIHGDIEAAKNILDAFYRSRCKIKAGINSNLATVFDNRIADLLDEAFGAVTVHDADLITDEQYLDATGLGDTMLSVIRRTIAAIKEGAIYEDWATNEIDEMIDDPADMKQIAKILKSESGDTQARRGVHDWVTSKPKKKVSA